MFFFYLITLKFKCIPFRLLEISDSLSDEDGMFKFIFVKDLSFSLISVFFSDGLFLL